MKLKTSITILIILVIGMVLGIYGHIEYQKFHPIGEWNVFILKNNPAPYKFCQRTVPATVRFFIPGATTKINLR
ncbi:hypothetical protein ABES02_07980 [Neobacillus pocheonensis]|uniref:hypothetical protein n=1 Tax=Neobacillus pocheonensis TaxID=363869 RepID=UPI003D29ED57